MRFALCISGYFSNIDKDDLTKTNYIQDNIIKHILENNNTCDIFIHSFDITNERNILNKYQNVSKYIIEEQHDFNKILNDENRIFINLLNKEYDLSKYPQYNIFSTLSFMYSRSKSIKLAIEYAEENNIKYNAIIRVRFDIGIRLKMPHLGLKPDNLVFNPKDNYNYNYFYSSYWNQLNAGYADFWEFSNMENMNILSGIYDFITSQCFVIDSLFLSCLNDWFESDKNNELTNVRLQPNKDIYKNAKIDKIHCLNNHYIEKYFCLCNGLYTKSKFLDFT